MHFAHGNGYPPGAYQPLIDLLSNRYRILAMRMRPLWENASLESFHDWRPLAEDLGNFLGEEGLTGILGAGHSMGATTTLRLALRQPQRFRALTLIDPVFFPPRIVYLNDLIYRLRLAYRIQPMVKGTLRRKAVFEDREAMFANYRQKPVFQGISDAGLHAYVDAMAHPRPDGRVELAYPPQWEARVYATGMRADMEIWRALPDLVAPLLIIRGARKGTFWEETGKAVKRRLPTAQVITIPDSTHLVPFEKPNDVADGMLAFLDSLNLKNSRL